MPRITMAVHGNAFCSEQTSPIVGYDSAGYPVHSGVQHDSGFPRGWGRIFFQSGWYHVAIPNVTYFDGAAMYLDEVLVLLTTRTNMRFDRVDLWIADNRFWSGPPSVDDGSRVLLFRPRNPSGQRMQVNSGLGVSLYFTNTGGGYVTFASASATLQSVI